MSSDANAMALRGIAETEPVFGGPERAGAALGLGEGELGHAGPPFRAAAEIPATALNALIGAMLHEG